MMERRGVMDLSGYRDHFIICGWKEAMDKMLAEIVYNNPKLNLKKVIIIAHVEPDFLEIFQQQYPAYHEISILRGEYYNEALLRKASVEQATEVFILADESNPSASQTEVDSKTVMTAMTIRAITKNVRICAELLDAKFERYLKTAHVEDIIYTNEYSKVLIANSFSQIGISKVINELLSTHTPAFIETSKIPDSFIGKQFFELNTYFRKARKSICIGLIENVGSFFERKQEALRDAQKTADMGKLIDNLKGVRRLENNLPNINPADDYPIPHNSIAVLVTTRPA
jgi:voltage-gated potassium channel